MEQAFEIHTTIKITDENKTIIKNLVKSLEAAGAIDENTAKLVVSAAECMDLF